MLAMSALLIAVACGVDDTDTSPEDDPEESSEPSTFAKKRLGTDGGTISTDNASLQFPPGALPGNVEIRVTELDDEAVGALAGLPPGTTFASQPVAFEPHGLVFDEPVEVSLDYRGGASQRLVVAKLDDEEDETWSADADAEFRNGKATFTITSFSIWAVLDDPEGAFVTTGSGGSSGDGSGAGGSNPSTGGQSTLPSGGGGQSSGDGGQSGGSGGQSGGTGGQPTGGSGGQSGGSGGQGEIPPGDFGYFDTGTLSGFAHDEAFGGATITSDVASHAGFPFCASGTVPATPPTARAGIRFDLGVPLEGGPQVDHVPVHDGIAFGFQSDSAENLVVRLVTDSVEYCTGILGPGGSFSMFLPWSLFGQCGGGDPYDGVTPIRHIGVEVLANGESAIDFSYCVDLIDDVLGPLPGYFQSSTFAGFSSEYAVGSGSISSNAASALVGEPRCASGSVGPDSDDASGFGLAFQLNQSRQGVVDTYVPSAGGIDFDNFDFLGNGGLRAAVEDGEGGRWCAPFPQSEPFAFIPWSAFRSDCSLGGGGTPYPLTPLERLIIDLPAASSGEFPFDFCLFDFFDVPTPRIAYHVSDTFQGYVTAQTTGTATITDTNLDTQREPSEFCISGVLPAGLGNDVAMQLFLNQPSGDGPSEPASPYTPEYEYLEIHVNADFSPVQELVLSDGTNEWCAPFQTNSVQQLPWEDFTRCDDPETSYAREPILTATVRHESAETFGTPYYFCTIYLLDMTIF